MHITIEVFQTTLASKIHAADNYVTENEVGNLLLSGATSVESAFQQLTSGILQMLKKINIDRIWHTE